MNESYTCSINSNKIGNSINVLNSIKNIIDNNDLFDYIQDIEKCINDTNFEHGNCIDNYKQDISILYSKVEEIKQDLTSLIDSLYFSVEKVSNSGTINSGTLKELIKFYKDSPTGEKLSKLLSESTDSIGNVAMRKVMTMQDPGVSSVGGYNNYQDQNNITTIPPVQTPNQEVVQEKPYSTIPIGLGIAATGITAAAGTVYVDSKYEGTNQQPKKFVMEDYHESDNYEDSNDYSEDDSETIKAEPYPKIEEEYVPPYHASRIQPSENVFYDFDEEK